MQRVALAMPKYQQVYEALRREIESGVLPPGARVPSEADLGRRFGASRITVGRAVRDLQHLGLVERKVGSGTFVRGPRLGSGSGPQAGDCTFAVLVPDLPDIEIFEPLVQGLMSAPAARAHAFLWGGGDETAGPSRAAAAWRRTQQYIARGVDGVFLAPLEGLAPDDPTNLRIVTALDAARIPVVLLDRSVHPYPKRGPYDLVGIDNRRVGFAITEHLLGHGASRVAFLAASRAASTVQARRAGYREALDALGGDPGLASVPVPAPSDREAVARYLDVHRPDAVVCANDRGAAQLMHTVLALGRTVPTDLRITGVDDVEYAGWLPVPLTTMRQPVRQIGEAALAAMLERRTRPDGPARDIFVQATLVVRESCGAVAAQRAESA
ncbi:MAG: substrate-binding domain-containing protein [Acidobacteria bacterium]|nr:substrate-binding domain-containing protein [Acidobacteriota bacterium]